MESSGIHVHVSITMGMGFGSVSVTMCFMSVVFMKLNLIVVLLSSMSVAVALCDVSVHLFSQMEVLITTMENPDLDDVEEKADDSDDKHKTSLHLWGHEEALGGGNEQPNSHNPDRDDRNERSNELSAMVAKTHLGSGFPLTEFNSGHGNDEAHHITGKMRSIGENGNRARDISTN